LKDLLNLLNTYIYSLVRCMVSIYSYIQIGIIFIVSVSLHEFAHAYASYKLGDPTPKIQWRLTPNPIKHIDPIWFILIFLIGFGRGRPVQIDPSYYKKPYRDELIVALAGPLTNVILGILAIIIMMVYMKTFALGLNALSTQTDLVIQFWITFAVTNFALAAFNMIPLPPLDGYRLIKVFNHNAGAFLEKNVWIISILFLALVIFWPFKGILWEYISRVAYGLFRMLVFPFSQLFF